MNSPSDAEIIAGFLGYHRMALDQEKILRRTVEGPWAVELVQNLAYDDSSRCWRVLSAIGKTNPSDDVMGTLGVSLGAALREHPSLIAEIEDDVRADAELSELLSWVMEDDYIEPDVWRRVESLSGSPR